MSDMEDYSKHTFLSRVFGMNSNSNSHTHNDIPLFNDDNNNLQFSIHEIQNNYLDNKDKDEEDIGKDDDEYILSEIRTNNKSKSSILKNKKLRSNISINLNSENESSSENEDEDGNSNENIQRDNDKDSPYISQTSSRNSIPDPNLYFSNPNDSNSNSQKQFGLTKSQKDLLREQLESELDMNDTYEDDDLINMVPESLLLENLNSKGFKKNQQNLYNQTKFPAKNDQNFIQRLEQSFLEQKEQVITPAINQFSEKALDFANKTFEKIPKNLNFQFPNSQSSSKFLSYKKPDKNEETRINRNHPLFNVKNLPPKERALWMWANITNLDCFLQDVYDYYIGNGYQCIALTRIFDLLIIVFVVVLSSFMGNCINYSKLMNQSVTKFQEVKIDQCYAKTSSGQKFFYFVLIVVMILRIKNCWEELRDLKEIRMFYNHLLNIDDLELQTIRWPQIIKKIMILRDQNTNAVISGSQNLNSAGQKIMDDLKSKSRLNAHEIANRLMRKENYMIAMFNKNILNQALSLPVFHTFFLTKTLEWNLKLCIIDFLFNKEGQLKQSVTSQHSRLTLSKSLRSRFRLAGLLSIFLTPFLVVYFVLYFFLKFFYDFKTNPDLLSAREYSPYSRWKMREFNELPHLFDQRLKLSIEGADSYLNQFPKERMNIIMRFITFVSGSIVAILAVLTVTDHENFLNFELTEGRTVLFYMSTLGAVFTICKNSISDGNVVFDPEASLRYVSQFTHYLPNSWEGRFHTENVRNEFCKLYNLKMVLIFKELCSLILLPYLLYISLPKSSDKIIDFFRDFSVHVDGLGYVCSFAVFNLDEKGDKVRTKLLSRNKKQNKTDPNNDKNDEEEDDDDDLKDDYYSTNDDKMIKSYMYFLESYGGNGEIRKNDLDDKIPDTEQNGKSFKASKNNMLKSAVLNSTYLDKRTPPNLVSNRFPQNSSRRYPMMSNSLTENQNKTMTHRNVSYNFKNDDHDYNSSNKSIMKNCRFEEHLEETSAGLLSNDTKNYLDGLSNSLMLGESFQLGYPVEREKNSNSNTGDDNEIEEDDGGVLGLLSQIYKHKGRAK